MTREQWSETGGERKEAPERVGETRPSFQSTSRDADSPFLDGQYAAFGKVTDGMDIVDKIASVRTGTLGFYMADVPRESVVIESIRLVSEQWLVDSGQKDAGK